MREQVFLLEVYVESKEEIINALREAMEQIERDGLELDGEANGNCQLVTAQKYACNLCGS